MIFNPEEGSGKFLQNLVPTCKTTVRHNLEKPQSAYGRFFISFLPVRVFVACAQRKHAY
jgi:hypothetical protein